MRSVGEFGAPLQISTGFAPWHRYCTASSSGRQPNFAALNRGRHLYSAGRPSRLALAHISSVRYVSKQSRHTFRFFSVNVVQFFNTTIRGTLTAEDRCGRRGCRAGDDLHKLRDMCCEDSHIFNSSSSRPSPTGVRRLHRRRTISIFVACWTTSADVRQLANCQLGQVSSRTAEVADWSTCGCRRRQ